MTALEKGKKKPINYSVEEDLDVFQLPPRSVVHGSKESQPEQDERETRDSKRRKKQTYRRSLFTLRGILILFFLLMVMIPLFYYRDAIELYFNSDQPTPTRINPIGEEVIVEQVSE